MLKIILLFTVFSLGNAFCEDESPLDFESELHALETNQLKAEEQEIRNVDAVTGIEDEVTRAQAAIKKDDKSDEPSKKEILEKEETKKASVRRVRSR